ncbi:MAG: drug resistance transporter, EmrB/QacA subfamily [Acidobacteria bacterium]|nr:drug resistance transporter, EmrB/QacA subfamily [Acidobacteriota bacterium]
MALGVGTFMSALDGSVVNTILPILGRELHASVAGIEWVTTIYLLVVSALLLGVGRAGDLYGHKVVYLAGFALFIAGSALCGAAGSVHLLVAMRGLQAVGASMLYANAPAILTKSFPAEQRGKVLGAQATFTYLGLTAGPSLGGWLAHAFGWRAVFYINVPIGALAVLMAWRVVERDRPERRSERFDYSGAALFTGGLVTLLIALNQGHDRGWGSPEIVGLFAAALVLLSAFVTVERRKASPMLDLSLFQSRIFSASTVAALCNYVCVYAVLFVLPFLLIQGRGLNTQQAGLLLTAQPIVMAIVAPLAGSLSDRIGSRILAVAGMAVLTVGLLLLARFAPAAPLGMLALAMAVIGFGIGLFTSPNNSALMGAAPRHRQGIAAGVLACARNVGMVLGVGLAGAVFTSVLAAGGAGALAHGVQMTLFVSAGVAAAGTLVALLSR